MTALFRSEYDVIVAHQAFFNNVGQRNVDAAHYRKEAATHIWAFNFFFLSFLCFSDPWSVLLRSLDEMHLSETEKFKAFLHNGCLAMPPGAKQAQISIE